MDEIKEKVRRFNKRHNYNTKAEIDDYGRVVIRLHGNPIVEFDAKRAVLRTCGWRTQTTKTRLNQVSEHFGLGYLVFQEKGEWYVKRGDKEYEFDPSDNHMVHFSGDEYYDPREELA